MKSFRWLLARIGGPGETAQPADGRAATASTVDIDLSAPGIASSADEPNTDYDVHSLGTPLEGQRGEPAPRR